jgi:hypothetical protein
MVDSIFQDLHYGVVAGPGLAPVCSARNAVRSPASTAATGSPWMYGAMVLLFSGVTLA